MTTHDPREHIRGIHQILVSDKKRIGFLFGAGTSFATNVENIRIPAIEEMTNIIVSRVCCDKFKKAIEEIRSEIHSTSGSFNIESLLSNIEAKHAVIASGKLNGLNSSEFKELKSLIKDCVVELISVHTKFPDIEWKTLAHVRLASWIQKAKRRHPAEIFTTNYDYLFEIALERSGIPYFDGFSGSFEPFFCPEAVEDIDAYPHLVKLWKMHGSLGWIFRDVDKAVIRKHAPSNDSTLIYPSHLKYNISKKQPYVGLIDRLCAFLQQDDAVLFTCGYSFGDDHINERIVTSLRRGTSSHVIAMYYDESVKNGKKEYALANESNSIRSLATHDTGGKMSVYGLRHAVVGGVFGEWKLRDQPKQEESYEIGKYFDEDRLEGSGNGENQKTEHWQGTGQFLLPDFCKLTNFLDDMSSSGVS